MIPLLFVYFIATLKVFKKTTPNGTVVVLTNCGDARKKKYIYINLCFR